MPYAALRGWRNAKKTSLPGEPLRDVPERRPVDRLLPSGPMTLQQIRDRAAAVVAIVGVVGGLLALAWQYDPGLQLGYDAASGRVVVTQVDPYGQAQRDGVRVGLVATDLNGVQLIRFPEAIYDRTKPENPDDGTLPVLRYEPPVPTNLADESAIANLLAARIESANFVEPSTLSAAPPDQLCCFRSVYYPGWYRLGESGLAILPGLVILFLGGWWLSTGRAGESLRGLALPLAVATAAPLFVLPLSNTGSPMAMVASRLIVVGAMVPLAAGLMERIEDRTDQRWAAMSVGLFGGASAVIAVLYVVNLQQQDVLDGLNWALPAAITLVPGLIAAGPRNGAATSAGGLRGPGGLLRSTEYAIAGATPFFSIASTPNPPFVFPLLLWLGLIAFAGRFTIRPLARLATRAQLQRDLVVAATEAERARLAADIHDDALQELTLLVRRLETAGDTEGAEIGRTVADRLRAICGDLRLPILDDLGVGPALDWLVLRIERLAGGEVRLERSDDARHSPDVELAIFRVAQEALANAVKHGRPPIVVRYRSTETGISLAIDDAGPGIAEGAPDAAEKAGRFGLLNMAQRAEAIGAILDIRRWPSGGTHVALEWRPR